LKDEKLQSLLAEELPPDSIAAEEHKKQLNDTESRWTKEGLLDIREEYGDENAIKEGVGSGKDQEQDSEDDDFETQLRKNRQRLAQNNKDLTNKVIPPKEEEKKFI
jgi:hypothetical protein